MKILFHHRIASRDGQSVHMDELIAALRRQGHEVAVVGPPRVSTERFGCSGGSVELLKRLLPRALYEILEIGYNAVAFLRLVRAIQAFRPDVIYERYNLFLLCGIWGARLFGIPLLLEVNAPLCAERSQHDGLSLQRIGRWCEGAIWRGASAVLPVTEVLARMVAGRGVPAERITVIPNGIDRARFPADPDTVAAKRALGLEGRLVLGFTGFVRAWHGLEEVVDLLAELRGDQSAHLLVVGDGPARETLERRADELGVRDRLTVTGVVERDAVTGYAAAFDIALQPAVTPYASPLKLFEYMALGRAIVAPDTPNIREILTDGRDAVLFPAATPGALGKAVRRLCGDPDLRQRVAAGAMLTVEQRDLTWDGNAERVAGLACGLAGGRPASGHPYPAL